MRHTLLAVDIENRSNGMVVQEFHVLGKDFQMTTMQTQERTRSATVQKLIDSGPQSLADFIASIVAAGNRQYSDFGPDDVVTFRIRPRSGHEAEVIGNFFVESFIEDSEDSSESFRQAISAAFESAGPPRCCGGACGTPSATKPVSTPTSWQVLVRPSTKGLNIPKKALDYLIPDRDIYTPLYVRPIEGSTDKFLVNATAGQGACWEVYANKDGRYIINVTIQRKAFDDVIGRKNRGSAYTPRGWTVEPNGSTGNSVIYTLTN